jgi:riboflavin kinase/FMN adenylyltransferase
MPIQKTITGVVVHGDARGRELGFPTANVAVSDSSVLPPNGIYAGWLMRSDGRRLASAISVGRRPTFYSDDPPRLLEVHVIDWAGDLYDEPVTVEFSHYVRDERRFENVPDLVTQMTIDCDEIRTRLTEGVA